MNVAYGVSVWLAAMIKHTLKSFLNGAIAVSVINAASRVVKFWAVKNIFADLFFLLFPSCV